MNDERMSEPQKAHPPTWVPRLILMVAAGFLATYLVFWSVIQLRSFLTLLLLALFAYFALEPAVAFLAKRGVRRGLATGLVFLAALLAVVLFVGVTLPPLVSEVAALMAALPDWLENLTVTLQDSFGVDLNLSNLSEGAIDIEDALETYADSLASGLLGVVGVGARVVGVVLQSFTLAMFTFYLLADGPRFRRLVLSVVKPERQAEVQRGWEIAIAKTGGYVYSRGLLALVSAVATFVFLELIGIPYSLALAVWVGVVSQFVPTVGTYLAGVVPILVGLTISPLTALVVLAGILVYQQFENVVLSPRITARTMSLHPAVAFGSVIVGGTLLGPVGALVALPAAAIIQALLSVYVPRYEVEEPHSETADEADHEDDPSPS